MLWHFIAEEENNKRQRPGCILWENSQVVRRARCPSKSSNSLPRRASSEGNPESVSWPHNYDVVNINVQRKSFLSASGTPIGMSDALQKRWRIYWVGRYGGFPQYLFQHRYKEWEVEEHIITGQWNFKYFGKSWMRREEVRSFLFLSKTSKIQSDHLTRSWLNANSFWINSLLHKLLSLCLGTLNKHHNNDIIL